MMGYNDGLSFLSALSGHVVTTYIYICVYISHMVLPLQIGVTEQVSCVLLLPSHRHT